MAMFNPALTLSDDPEMASTQEALIILSAEFNEVASEEVTAGTIARMTRLLAQKHQYLNSMTSMANGGHGSF